MPIIVDFMTAVDSNEWHCQLGEQVSLLLDCKIADDMADRQNEGTAAGSRQAGGERVVPLRINMRSRLTHARWIF